MAAYLEAIRLNPSEAIFYSNAANCYFHLRQHERVIQICEEALRLSPSLTKAVYRRGLAYAELGMLKLAIHDLKRVVQAMPGDQEAKKRLVECEKEQRKLAFASAIKKDQFDLTHSCIDKIEVEPGYTGPRITNNGINMEFVKELIEYYKTEKKLHPRYVYEIMLQAKQWFEKEPNCVFITIQPDQKMTICGDIHGQFFDLCKIFDINGLPSEKHIYVHNLILLTSHLSPPPSLFM